MSRLRYIYLISICTLLFMTGLAVAGPNPGGVEPINELFSDVSASQADELQTKQSLKSQDSTIIRSRYVRVNFDYLTETDSIVLNLFSNVSEKAVRESVERRSESRYSWFGRIGGMKHSSVVLTVEDGNMAGNITVDGKTYQVRSIENGIHAVREFDQSKLPPEVPPIPVEIPEQDPEAALSLEPQLDGADIIDILVVYTDDVAAAAVYLVAMRIQPPDKRFWSMRG